VTGVAHPARHLENNQSAERPAHEVVRSFVLYFVNGRHVHV
jgi:hypothetical protein